MNNTNTLIWKLPATYDELYQDRMIAKYKNINGRIFIIVPTITKTTKTHNAKNDARRTTPRTLVAMLVKITSSVKINDNEIK